MTHKPTAEQQAIINAGRDTDENLLIDALAGAAKTSTLVMLTEEVRVPTRAIAFNKRIADELQGRVPGHVECSTLHSLGIKLWQRHLGRRVKVNKTKRRDILTELVDDLSKSDADAVWENMSDMNKAIEHACSSGFVPSRCEGRGIVDEAEFFGKLHWRASDLELDLIAEVQRRAIKAGLKGEIDFNDMVLLPAIFRVNFSEFQRPLTLVDEAQDLSVLNHRLIAKLVGDSGRLIAVGDQRQAIYEFRGANSKAMQAIIRDFRTTQFPLSVSFRAPRAVAEHVRWRAPDIKSPEWAIEGSVDYLDKWSPADIPEHATIICRNNAPLFKMALRLLQEGRRPQLVGRDIVSGLVKDMKKFGPLSMTQEEAFAAVDKWEAAANIKYREADWVGDKAECFRIFIAEADKLGSAIEYAKHVLDASGPIQLMTGHKSKGLEFPVVFFLDEYLIRGGEDTFNQEDNLRYVIATRAQERLIYVRSEDFRADET